MKASFLILAGAIAALAALPVNAQSPTLRVMGFSGSSNWPIFVAQEKGLFARHGVEVRLSPAPNSATQLASLIDGRIDIAMTAFDNVVAYEDGGIFAFLGVNNGGRFNLMVAPTVKGYADLKGRALAVDALSTGYAFVLMAMLQRGGGLAVGEYALVSVGGSRERLAALRSGKVAGTLLNAPQDAAAEAAGFLRLANSGEAVNRYQGSVGAARRSWAAANSDALVRYIRAYVAAVDWLYEPSNRAEAIDLLQRRLADVTPEAGARSYHELLDPAHGSLSRKAAIDVEGVQTVLRLRGEFARPPKVLRDPSRYYELTYYERALRND
jgi:ABC-type nitrate/sulfonate/bicarbonate transport system substrate-binding protein